jgi:hypothetical protein
LPLAQSEDEAQVLGQLAVEPRQRYGAQLGDPPPLTLVQVPLAAAPSAALHTSQLPEQALLQQKPSTQLPLEHWTAAEQAAPCASLPTHLLVPSQ